MSASTNSNSTEKCARVQVSIINKPSSLLFKRCGIFYAKKIIRSLLGMQRGPDVVLKSLVRGLQLSDLGGAVEFNINPSKRDLHRTVHVLSNPVALEWAIEQKKLGKIDKLIAGPNVSILPSFDGGVFQSPEIDLILLPSEWTKDAYAKDVPTLADKIRVWPSGVAIPASSPAENYDAMPSTKDFYIVFRKTFSNEAFTKITAKLAQMNVPFKALIYGTFKQAEYFELLTRAKGMIYLQEAESQGIALQEAWARNVPTLVWDSKSYTYKNVDRQGGKGNAGSITIEGKVSAPYLTDESGMFFDSLEKFDQKFREFDSKISSPIDSYRARDYCIENLSDLASAKKYIEYIS